MYHSKRGRRMMAQYMKMRGGKHGRGGSRRRPLGHGDLRLLILSLLEEEPRHGYDLISEIEVRTDGAYKPSPGVMYPALEVLRDIGLAKSKAEGGKKVFHLTDAGKAELEANAETVSAINARLAALASPSEPDDPSDVRAAMRRLRHTTFRTVMTAWPDTAQHEKIADILRQARTEIEGLI